MYSGGENDSKVGVIGSSSGGNIAATVAFEVPGLDYQVCTFCIVAVIFLCCILSC